MPARQIAPLALNQLMAWQRWAKEWPVSIAMRTTETGHRLGTGVIQWHLICVPCQQTITVLMSEAIPYLLSSRMILDDTTRHIRNVHRDLEDSVYGGKDPQATLGFGTSRTADSGGSNPS